MDRIGFHSRLFPVQFEEEKVQVPEQAAPVTSSQRRGACWQDWLSSAWGGPWEDGS